MPRTLQSWFLICWLAFPFLGFSQIKWTNVDSLYQPLPKSLHVYFTDNSIDTAPFKAFYVIADLKDKNLNFTTDTTFKRRLTPTEFFQKNNEPLLVVNGTFFSFETNANLNVVIREGKVVSYNSKTKKLATDTTKRVKVYTGALGITKDRNADVAWVKTDSSKSFAHAIQTSDNHGNYFAGKTNTTGQTQNKSSDLFKRWNMQTAIGGGPVLIQNGKIKISNNEEGMFAGKAIHDKHPRTAMGYTKENKLIILVVEGRNPEADGATLPQEAQILKDLGCIEALNLDGGGSSCLLINGKETIAPSDKRQRPVPAVFMIHKN